MLVVGSYCYLYAAFIAVTLYVISYHEGLWYKEAPLHIDGLVKKDVTPVRQQWRCVFLALTHRYVLDRIGPLLVSDTNKVIVQTSACFHFWLKNKLRPW